MDVERLSCYSLGIMANSRKQVSKRGKIVRNVLNGASRPEDLADAARRQLARLGMPRPAMRDVPTALGEAHWRELEARRQVDALVILARFKGMTWNAIGGLIGTTPQGALARHNRAARRMRLVPNDQPAT